MTGSPIVRVTAEIAIPRREIRFAFVRSSGPGGQNVNKVASKAVLRWNLASSPSITGELRARLVARLGRRINDRGELVLTSQRYRDQAKNVDDCLEKFRDLIRTAARIPKKRKKTRIPRAVREARLRQKRTTSVKKQGRQKPSAED